MKQTAVDLDNADCLTYLYPLSEEQYHEFNCLSSVFMQGEGIYHFAIPFGIYEVL